MTAGNASLMERRLRLAAMLVFAGIVIEALALGSSDGVLGVRDDRHSVRVDGSAGVPLVAGFGRGTLDR